jgi:hypothetical protein
MYQHADLVRWRFAAPDLLPPPSGELNPLISKDAMLAVGLPQGDRP